MNGGPKRTWNVSKLSLSSVQRSTIESMSEPPVRLRYSIYEVADMLGVNHKTIRRRIKAGQIRAVRDGSRVYISWDELDRYAKRGPELKAS